MRRLPAAVAVPALLAAPLWAWIGLAALAADDERVVTPVFPLIFVLPLASAAVVAARRRSAGAALAALAIGAALALATVVVWFAAAGHLCGDRYECPF